MDKKLSEKLYFSLIMTDFDYISVRHLMAASLFPSAGQLANITIDRYIKTYFWSINRDDLVDKIKKWRGNKSHNILKIIEIYNKEFNNKPLELNSSEEAMLEGIYRCYCFRYIDEMYRIKKICKVFKNYMFTIDKVCAFFRNQIKLIPPHKGNTIIEILIENNPNKLAALNTGNVNLREVLLASNPYFIINK